VHSDALLNLPHGNDNQKVENRKKTKEYERICSEVTVKVWGIHVVSPEEEKEGYPVGRICRKGRF